MPEYYAMYQRDPDYLGALCVTYLSGWYSDLFSVLVQFSSPCRYTYGCPPPFLSPSPTTAQRTMFDGQLGRLMQILKDTGVYGNTVVFYTADNGPHQGAERTDIHWSTNFLRQCKVGHLFLIFFSLSLPLSLAPSLCISVYFQVEPYTPEVQILLAGETFGPNAVAKKYATFCRIECFSCLVKAEE